MRHITLILTTSLLCASFASAGTLEPDARGKAPENGTRMNGVRTPGWQPPPANVGEWADRCTDFTANGWGFKDPKNTVRLIETFTNPAIYLEFARRMEDPESYARIISLMLEPGTVKNHLEWSDPAIYMKWTQALVDPNFYTAAMRPFMDGTTYLRWMALPVDQRAWQVGLNLFNPALWMKWSTAAMNPRVTAPLAKVGDPNTTLKWLQAAGDPANFKAWNGWPPSPNGQINGGGASNASPSTPDKGLAVPGGPGNPAITPGNGAGNPWLRP